MCDKQWCQTAKVNGQNVPDVVAQGHIRAPRAFYFLHWSTPQRMQMASVFHFIALYHVDKRLLLRETDASEFLEVVSCPRAIYSHTFSSSSLPFTPVTMMKQILALFALVASASAFVQPTSTGMSLDLANGLSFPHFGVTKVVPSFSCRICTKSTWSSARMYLFVQWICPL
jgi:hypothetical protein